MTNEEFYALKIKLLELPDEQYYDAVIQQLNADREELMNYRMAKIPFKTKPLFNDYTNINIVS
jgi:hypothetical protein